MEQRKKTLISIVDSNVHYPLYCCKGDVVCTKSIPLYNQQEKLKNMNVTVSDDQRGAIIGTLAFREISEIQFKERFGIGFLLPNCIQRLEIVHRVKFPKPIPLGIKVNWPGFVKLPEDVYEHAVDQFYRCRNW